MRGSITLIRVNYSPGILSPHKPSYNVMNISELRSSMRFTLRGTVSCAKMVLAVLIIPTMKKVTFFKINRYILENDW